MMTTCLTCGEPSEQAYCPDHKTPHAPKAKTSTERGYDHRWQKLSKRARRIQPFCTDCGSTENLTLDHSPRAWERYYTGKNIRLIDTAVLCMDCNIARGQQRPGEDTPTTSTQDPLREAKCPTDTPYGYMGGGRNA